MATPGQEKIDNLLKKFDYGVIGMMTAQNILNGWLVQKEISESEHQSAVQSLSACVDTEVLP